MRIGFDAKWFFSGPPSGKLVVQQLVRHLVQLTRGRHELFVFLDSADRNMQFPHVDEHVHVRYIWARNNLISNAFVLPIHAKRLGTEVLVCQNFPPLGRAISSIDFVYDALYLSYPEYFTWRERIYFSPIKPLVRFSRLLCTISNAEKSRLLEHGFRDRGDEIAVIYLGVDPLFRPKGEHDASHLDDVRRKYQLPGNYLLYVGRLNERKNVRNLIHSIPLLQNSGVSLVLAGSRDWKMFDLDGLINQCGIAHRVKQLGSVPSEDLPALYALATIFCFPSFAEAFGLPPLEAMASGVPVVVSNTTSLPEICGDAGNYVDPANPQSIASAIDELLRDKALCERKTIAGIDRASQFTWRSSAITLLQCIESIGTT